MNHLDDEIYQANQRTIEENQKLSQAQEQQISQIIDSKLSSISQENSKQKTNLDYYMCKLDPNKPDFDEVCKLGLSLLKENEALQAAFHKAENKPEFAYDIGLREKAYQQLYKQPAQQQNNQQVIPPPQTNSSPYQGVMDVNNVQWGSLTEDQFLTKLQELGIHL